MAFISKRKGNTRQRLLKDLSEIKAVLDVETQLVRALVRLAVQRQAAELKFA